MAMAIVRRQGTLDWQIRPPKKREPVPRAVAPESSGERRLAELLEAFGLLGRRGIGLSAWATPFRDDPLAFLLDTVSDGARIWNDKGELVCQNRAAAELGVGGRAEAAVDSFLMNGRRFERRCLRCRMRGADYVLEIVREVRSQSQTR